MAIPYQIREKKNPITGKSKFYAQIANLRPILLEQLAEEMSEESTVTRHDIKAVLSSLQAHIIKHLQNGDTVRLGDLGSFRPTIHSTGEEDKTKVDATSIKTVGVRFSKSGIMISELDLKNKNVSFVKDVPVTTPTTTPTNP